MDGQRSPGWYPDPDGSPLLRWWDGTDWSDRWQPADRSDPATTQGVSIVTVFVILVLGAAAFVAVLFALVALADSRTIG